MRNPEARAKIGKGIRKLFRKPYRELSPLLYPVSWAIQRILPAPASKDADWVFVIHPDFRGWILEAICRELGAHLRGKLVYHYNLASPLPSAGAYFFSHYSLFPAYLKLHPSLWGAKTFVWYTHPKDVGLRPRELDFALARSHRVIFTCDENRRRLVAEGLPETKARVLLGGADPNFFRSHIRGLGAVGFCSSYYPRKNPDMILQLVRGAPHRRFVLMGRRWENYARWNELSEMPNFTHLDWPYSRFPEFYDQLDVFVSPSSLEGGPIPLLEAMMSNCVPIATRTGFAPDLIRQGENGFIYDIEATAETVLPLIERAYAMDVDVRRTVVDLTWENMSQALERMKKDEDR